MIAASALAPERLMGPIASIVGQDHAMLREGTVVVAPGDAGQVAGVLRFAQSNGFAVMPAGSGTKAGWGHPVPAGIQLSMRRMARVREHAWQDMTCTVEAGCTWAAMQNTLASHGQMVALDPLWPERATVGGIIATNDSGALRIRFGGLRDLIIGMTFVLADGTIAKSGGKVVKNVAGYDLHKLMTGSFGTLGVIAEVNFRLHPVERLGRTWSVTARGAEAAERDADPASFAKPLFALMDSQMTPSGVQLRMSRKECALDIRIGALPECVADCDAQVRHIFDGFAVNTSDDAVWQARQRIFDSNYGLVVKASTIAGQVCSVASELRKWADAEGVELALVSQANGLMTIGLAAPHDTAVRFIEHFRARAGKFGGNAIALRIPDALRGEVDVWGAQNDALPPMREIKRRFDPGRILNPGRFVGNI